MARNLRPNDGGGYDDPLDDRQLPEAPLPSEPSGGADVTTPSRPSSKVPVWQETIGSARSRLGRRAGDVAGVEPPVVPPPTPIAGTFASPANPASMTPFRTPAFQENRYVSPFRRPDGGGNDFGDNEVSDYLRRLLRRRQIWF